MQNSAYRTAQIHPRNPRSGSFDSALYDWLISFVRPPFHSKKRSLPSYSNCNKLTGRKGTSTSFGSKEGQILGEVQLEAKAMAQLYSPQQLQELSIWLMTANPEGRQQFMLQFGKVWRASLQFHGLQEEDYEYAGPDPDLEDFSQPQDWSKTAFMKLSRPLKNHNSPITGHSAGTVRMIAMRSCRRLKKKARQQPLEGTTSRSSVPLQQVECKSLRSRRLMTLLLGQFHPPEKADCISNPGTGQWRR
jgi:hypothetical protein